VLGLVLVPERVLVPVLEQVLVEHRQLGCLIVLRL
jgi:hypothetical protein